jgi:methionyl-tRNA formyltransferase
MNKGKRIGVAGNQSTTIDLIKTLISYGYKIDCILNMPDDLNGSIAGYVDIKSVASKLGIPVLRPATYSLTSDEDVKKISKRRLDVLLVFGWQRLIPPWLLDSLSVGAFGTHGSWRPLPYGRGRSLLNWSLILGKDKLIDNLFKYNSGADSGDIIDSLEFKIDPSDTISSLHHKDQLVHQELLIKYLPKILSGKVKYKPQSKKEKEVFFPKRTPEDGVIDWSWKTMDLYNLIRALGKPYPGAFAWFGNKKIMIWRAIPFQIYPSFERKKIGEIVASFSDGTFVVRTGDGAILIQEYQAIKWKPSVRKKFKSVHNRTYDLLKENKIKW